MPVLSRVERPGWEVFVNALDRDVGDEPDPYVLPESQTLDPTPGSEASRGGGAGIDGRDTTVIWKVEEHASNGRS